MNIAVLGAGAWGTAIAISLARRHAVTLWARNSDQVAAMRARRTNERYLPGHPFPPALEVTDDLAVSLRAAELALVAVTTAALREILQRLQASASHAPVVWLCKGFEPGRAKLPHEVCAEELGSSAMVGVLSGPSFAQEVALGLPTALTLASRSAEFARDAAREVHGPALRVYSSDDVIGVEVAGAVKNVMAIATGICDGLALGGNARAALITRGLAEMGRFAEALGGRRETLMGLSGLGDLVLTCTGALSRNRTVGLSLAAGKSLASIERELGHVAEGIYAAEAVHRIAVRDGIDMPISEAVHRVLDGDLAPAEAVAGLLRREPARE